MKNTLRFVIAGVALGAIAGAIIGLLYTRATPAGEGPDGQRQEAQQELGLPQIARLGLLVLGAVKEILALT